MSVLRRSISDPDFLSKSLYFCLCDMYCSIEFYSANIVTVKRTRMHSSRMCTARSLTVSSRMSRTPPPCQHACYPLQPHMTSRNHAPPHNHAHPLATTHVLPQPHVPPQPCMPPATTHALCEQND